MAAPQSGYEDLNLKSEADRYKTFESWPLTFIDGRKLAAAGFFYTYRQDVVKCIFCGVEVGNWEVGDDPMNDHRKWSPSCPFLRKLPVGNIPLNTTNADIPPLPEIPRTYDVCGPYELEIRPNSAQESTAKPANEDTPLEKLGINKARAPVYTMFVTVDDRLKSFKSWPISIKQRPEKLSEAGFFYTGKSDKTVCFHCGGGLKDWEETDDPWVEHAKWFPKCSYVLLNKGKDFVTGVNGEKDIRVLTEEVKNIKVPSEFKDSLQIRMPIESSLNDQPSTSTETSLSLRAAEAAAAAVAEVENNEGKGDDVRLCKICYQEELGVVFLPCGHLVSCVKCAPSLTTCAVCRQPFTATVRVFFT